MGNDEAREDGGDEKACLLAESFRLEEIRSGEFATISGDTGPILKRK